MAAAFFGYIETQLYFLNREELRVIDIHLARAYFAVNFSVFFLGGSSQVREVAMEKALARPTTYELLRQHGVDRRSFLKFCTVMAAAMGLDATAVGKVVEALEKKPRIPVLWLHGLECTCCSESFIRS
jgi:hypothetical protein